MATFTITENFGTYGSTPTSAIHDGSTNECWQGDSQQVSGKYVRLESNVLIHVNSVTYTTSNSNEVFKAGAWLQYSVDGNAWTDVGEFTGSSRQTFTVSADCKFIRIYCKSGSNNYVSITELAVDYNEAVLVNHTVTVQCGDGVSTDQDGTNTVPDGTSFALTINGTISSITDNGDDVRGQVQEHTVTQDGTASSYPTSYTTNGNISGTRYRNAVGKGSSATASGNDYASGGSNAQATIIYRFDLSGIPEGASIDSVSVKVGGHAENASRSVANLQLYTGNTAKGSQGKFTSTSKQIVTLTAGTWTRAELQDAQLQFTIGYYGGLVNGVDFDVTYSVPGSGDIYYTYTISAVTAEHTILINMGGGGSVLWLQINGVIRTAAKIWMQENGQIVEVSADELDQNAHYHIIT